ncbi:MULTISPECIES: sulfur carrier protein ThiS [Myroides]|uniref:Sulfur carrier protein ThiS n=1 Tax=Myroides odoratus TaxID=256 RepID=A0A9Q7E7L6_MYROD|nr:sulfur carrier protein ThiS [Myroides odoratus]EHQ42245.1 sulfur carrier protein ThiS [Myroides odoratus DSM 2801]EKB09465.1 thiamine biosynthesis protein ThiS [Myroides odoratus CIP 103059]QQT99625.1 sulfur carrier protein ThiS [Myroides odoratus]WQD58168.1 sulfur carrier protein ThiS [Myroides odoratus]STZ29505.1 sulfur carrier protein ThiS [Myroides odoratus]
MELHINNQKFHFEQLQISIQTMLDLHGTTQQKGIAVAVNATVIAKADWSTYLLSEADDILIITATQGG